MRLSRRRYVPPLPRWDGPEDDAPRYALPPPETPPEDAAAETARLAELWQVYYGLTEPSPGGSEKP